MKKVAVHMFRSGEGRYTDSRDEGFMMLETLVAIVIISLVGLSVLGLTRSVVDGSTRMRQSLCGGWVVQNQIALLVITARPADKIIPEGEMQMCHSLWQWRVTRMQIPDPRVKLYAVKAYRNGEQIAQQQIILPAG